MFIVNVSEANKDIDKIWALAAENPVTIEDDGSPIAVVLSPDEYERLTTPRKPRRAGCGRDLLEGVDINALLATPIDDMFADYMPADPVEK